MPITINGTTGISGVDGSAGTPAVIGSDADTGLVFSAGRIQASLNGSLSNVGLTQATAQNSTSGTAIDFTSIPNWVKRITVMFNGVSTNGSSYLRVQIGAGSVDATGYASTNGTIGSVSVSGGTGGTAGWDIIISSASTTTSGTASICLISTNTWMFNAITSCITTTNTNITAGHKSALSGALDRVRITTVNGTDTFDAGSINILYE